MDGKLEKWAKYKGMRPLFRNEKGRFRNITKSSLEIIRICFGEEYSWQVAFRKKKEQ